MSDDEKTPTFDQVLNTARRWYYTVIAELAADYTKRIKDGEFGVGEEAREALDTDIHQTIDACAEVIYTARAAMVLAASDHDGAYEDQLGEKAPTVEAQAFMAMRTDLAERLEADGIDINDPAPEDADDEGEA